MEAEGRLVCERETPRECNFRKLPILLQALPQRNPPGYHYKDLREAIL